MFLDFLLEFKILFSQSAFLFHIILTPRDVFIHPWCSIVCNPALPKVVVYN